MGWRILLVEDNEDTVALISLILDQIDATYVVARNIKDGLELAGRKKFDLILLDNRLPDGDGTDLCSNIRKFDTITPIVFCTAAAYPADKEKGLQSGANAYLIKPDDIFHLGETILELIKRK